MFLLCSGFLSLCVVCLVCGFEILKIVWCSLVGVDDELERNAEWKAPTARIYMKFLSIKRPFRHLPMDGQFPCYWCACFHRNRIGAFFRVCSETRSLMTSPPLTRTPTTPSQPRQPAASLYAKPRPLSSGLFTSSHNCTLFRLTLHFLHLRGVDLMPKRAVLRDSCSEQEGQRTNQRLRLIEEHSFLQRVDHSYHTRLLEHPLSKPSTLLGCKGYWTIEMIHPA